MRIFVASSGRCGTGFLYSGFKKYTNISAFHEQSPVLVGSLLKEANQLGLENKVLKKKAKDICSKYPFYIDTAHQFMRGFYKYALSEMPMIKIIKLIRSPLEVASSRINRKVIPGKSGWLGRFDDEENLIKIPKTDWENFSDFKKVLLDWIEHEERFNFHKDKFLKVVYINFEELTKRPKASFERLFKELGIKKYKIHNPDSLNKNSNKKKSSYSDLEKKEFEDLVRYLKGLGYSLDWLKTPYYKKVL